MPSGHKPGSSCELFHTMIHKFSDNVPFHMPDINGNPVLFSYDRDFLKKLKEHKNIRKAIVIDLREQGDPIYAGRLLKIAAIQ